jgi:hypothetical protein
MPPKTLILLRATTLDRTNLEFANSLAAMSGAPVAFLLDGRHEIALPTQRPIISLTKAACEDLGLYCPADFAWRCGDYGLYLARRQFPDVRQFWIVEHDVRIFGRDPGNFFDTFRYLADLDFVGAYLTTAPKDWFWTAHASGIGITSYRCFFPVVRISARAVDALLAKRREHSRVASRRKMWPNDEGFVATTLSNRGFVCRDLNDFDRPFYDEQSFSFYEPIDGASVQSGEGDTRLMHPVLFGESYAAKLLRVREEISRPRPNFYRRQINKVTRGLIRMTPW